MPISAGLIKGRRATNCSAIKDDMVNAACVWEDAKVVVDGNLIPSRHPGDFGPWLCAIVEALGGWVIWGRARGLGSERSAAARHGR